MRSQGFIGAVVVVAMLAMLAVALQPAPASVAAPAAIPTPAASVNYGNSTGVSAPIQFWPQGVTVLTASGRSGCFELSGYDVLDLQYAVDVGDTQTVTVKLQYTNDRATYADGLTVVNAATADVATAMQQFPLFGRDTCLYATVATTAPVTVTVTGLAK